MALHSVEVTMFEPESNWHLCTYRGWLIAALPSFEGFAFEYLAPDGENRGSDHLNYSSVAVAIKQAKIAIKRRATVWLIDQWLCEVQEQGKIDFQEYCRLFRSMH